MWNSVFVKVHNHSRIKSFLQSIYLKSSVHRLWVWQRIFPHSLGLISFLETAIKISLTHSRVLYLHSVLVLRPVTNTRLLMSTAKQTEQPHILPCLLVLPGHHAVLLPCCRAACSAGFSSAAIQVSSCRTGSTGIRAHHHLQQIHDIMS